MTSPHPGPPPLRDYEVEGAVFSSAQATVYMGRQRFSGQRVSLHLLHPALVASNPAVGGRLATAARRAAQVQNPAVVATYDVISEPGAVGVVTEPLEGAWLGELAPPGTALPPAVALSIVDGVLAALEAAHAAGVAHGRISPDVVLVTPAGQPRLDGFAISSALAGDDRPDAAADLWATANLAYVLLSGVMPTGGAAEQSKPTVAGVSEVLDRALARDPAERYATAAELRSALLGATFSALGPAWRMNSDLDERVATAVAQRGSAAGAPVQSAPLPSPTGGETTIPAPITALPPVGAAAAAAVQAAIEQERTPPAGAPVPASTGPVQGFRTPPPPGSAVLSGIDPPPLARPPDMPPQSYLPPPPQRPAPIAPPPARKRKRSTILIILAVAILVLGGAAAAVVLLTRGGSGPLAVGSDVKLEVTKVPGSNCDNTFNFAATGSLTGSGTLIYHFERSDGQRTDDMKVQIDGNPGFNFTTSWRFLGQRTGKQTMTFIISSPTTRQVNKDFDTTCP